MKRKHIMIVFLIIIVISFTSCGKIQECPEKDYGLLMSAITYSVDKVIGEYGDQIPNDFSGEDFMILVNDKIPPDYYTELKKYKIQIQSKGYYYLSIVTEPKSGKTILFDYSCTSYVDGKIFLEPNKYDLANLELYNPCSSEDTDIKPQVISIASFNIQVFGQSKIKKPEVMDIIAKIIKKYDVVAIQEIRSKEQNVIPALLNLVNDEDTKYDYVISERLGRTSSKEQYAFVYNPKTVTLIPDSTYVVDDPDDVFEREPFVSYFKSGNFDFKIVNNHIKPGDVSNELKHLAVVINDIYDSSAEKDIIVVGDMNADGSYFNEDNLVVILPLWVQLIGNDKDTTVAVSDNTYDRMMTCDTTSSVEYTGTSGVFRWDNEYGITDIGFVKKVSDHYPVYAEFRVDLEDDD